MTAPSRELPIEPSRAALLIIDVQNYCTKGTEYFQRSLRDAVLPNIGRLQSACRRAGIEILYSVIENMTLDGRDRRPPMTCRHAAPTLAPAPPCRPAYLHTQTEVPVSWARFVRPHPKRSPVVMKSGGVVKLSVENADRRWCVQTRTSPLLEGPVHQRRS